MILQPAESSGPPAIVPLGDQAVLAYCASERHAVQFAENVRAAGFDWLLDVVPAYGSVGVFFDADRTSLGEVAESLESLPAVRRAEEQSGCLHIIPCCYEMQLDLARVAEQTSLDADAVVSLHSERTYTVYAIGFAPGFPYLGYLTPELCGVPRLATPRLQVEPGSVGLTGKQTGIYPLPRPGGWNIIGRTPLLLVDVAAGYFPLRVGDRVKFRRIDEREFKQLEGERLPDRSNSTSN